jgi:hypothetical protein
VLLGAAIISHREHEIPAKRSGWVTRGVLCVAAVAALIAIPIPFAMTAAIRSSQAAARSDHLNAALSDAMTAQSLEP